MRGKFSTRTNLLEHLESRILLSAFTVTSLADDGGTGELRWAIQQANAAGGTNTIGFKSGLIGIITLAAGQLELTSGNTTITAPGAASLTINGNKSSRIFQIDSGVTASVFGLTIANGSAIKGNGGGIANKGILTLNNCTVSGDSATTVNKSALYGFGGGIVGYSTGSLTLNNCTFSTNSADNLGGGIFSIGPSTITGCAFSKNVAGGSGGAIALESSTVGISNSSFSGNSAVAQGGGLVIFGCTATMSNCTISGNVSKGNAAGSEGGGISVSSTTLSIIGCTFFGNSTYADSLGKIGGVGGGIFQSGGNANIANSTLAGNSAAVRGGGFAVGTSNAVTTFNNCTLSANTANMGGGIGIYPPTSTLFPKVSLFNTIVAGNSTGDINGTIDIQLALGQQSSSNNLIGTGGSGGLLNGTNGNIVGVANPMLGTLQNNGGLTQTMALLTGSPAIDHGNNSLALDSLGKPLTTDQRGLPFVRIFNGMVDIGAFEFQPSAHLVFHVQPTTVIAGVKIAPSVVVYIENPSNQVITTDNSSITLKLAAGLGTLGGTVTVAAVKGIATFSNLIITKSGTGYKLSATDGTDTTATSTAFNVTPGAASKLAFTTQPIGTTAGKNVSPAIGVSIEDAFGNVVNTNTSAVTLAAKTGPGAIFGTATINAIAGVAKFSAVNFHFAGTYTIAATDTGLTAATSAGFKITAGAVAHFAFVQNPTNVVAGVNIAPAITIKATDAFGNVVSGASIKLAIGSSPVDGALFGTITATTAATGIATFSSVSLHIAGAYTLTASDGAIVSAKSTAFTVSAAKASKLVFTSLPVGAKHGVAFTLTVSVEDTYGNVLTAQNTGTVTLSLVTHPAGSTLGGTLTANVVKGVAIFNNLSVNLAGTYTLKASDSFAIAAATSASIVVS